MYLKSFRELIVWQKSMTLVKLIYQITDLLPKHEMYTLASQMRRAAISIPSNIAEGQQRRGVREFVQFLGIADGSSAELETQVLLSKDLYTLDDQEIRKCLSLIDEVQRMLHTMIIKLEARS